MGNYFQPGHGDQIKAALVQRSFAAGKRAAAHCIKDDVISLAILGEIFPGIVDQMIRAQRFDQIDLFRAANPGDFCPIILTKLDSGCADCAGSTGDQYAV